MLQREKAQLFYKLACIITANDQQRVKEIAKNINCLITINHTNLGYKVFASNVDILLSALQTQKIPFEEIRSE